MLPSWPAGVPGLRAQTLATYKGQVPGKTNPRYKSLLKVELGTNGGSIVATKITRENTVPNNKNSKLNAFDDIISWCMVLPLLSFSYQDQGQRS